MADTETLRRQVQSRAPFSTWLGVIFLFVLFGAIVLAVIGPSPRGDNYEQSRAKKRMEKLKALNETTTKQLSTYGWIDKNKGTVRIPVQRAMELAVAELSVKKPAPAYPIATPTPEAAGGAASASPAPAPSAQPRTSPKATSVGGTKPQAAGQPAAAIKPAGAQAGTQPGPAVTPAASPQTSPAGAPSSPSPNPSPTAGGSPLPVRGKSPSP
jgi:hypothetical protein